MSKTLNDPESTERPLNPNGPPSHGPSDGSRRSETPGREGATSRDSSEGDEQGQSTIEAFDEEGAGIAPKE